MSLEMDLGMKIVRMVGEELATEMAAVQMDVELRGGKAFVAEHRLDGAEVGASFKQMSGKTVTQRVGTHCLGYPCGSRRFLYYIEHHHPCQPCATPVEKQYVLGTGLRGHHAALDKVVAYPLHRHGRERHDALFAPLTFDENVLLIKKGSSESEGA